MARKARIRGLRKTGPKKRSKQGDFSLQVLVNSEMVYFDQIFHGADGEKKTFIVMTDKETGRNLGKWLVKHCA